MKRKKSDCEIIKGDFDNLFGSIGNCLETSLDDKKSKMQVVGSIFGIFGSTTKLLWHSTGCAVKKTPKAIATVANVKRELTEIITDDYQQYKKELKEEELNTKIKELKIGKR